MLIQCAFHAKWWKDLRTKNFNVWNIIKSNLSIDEKTQPK